MSTKSFIALLAALCTAAAPTEGLFAASTSPSALDLNLPSLGTAAGAELSPADEYELGKQLMTQVRADPTYMSDPETSEYLNRLVDIND